MITPALIEYIKSLRAAQVSEADIKTQLLQVGWNTEDIRQALQTQEQQKFVRGVTAPTIITQQTTSSALPDQKSTGADSNEDKQIPTATLKDVAIGDTTDSVLLSSGQTKTTEPTKMVDPQTATKNLQSHVPTVQPHAATTAATPVAAATGIDQSPTPQLAPQEQSAPASGSTNQSSGKRRTTLLATLALIVALVGGGLVYAYQAIWMSPERIVMQAVQNTFALKQFAYNAEAEMITTGDVVSGIADLQLDPNAPITEPAPSAPEFFAEQSSTRMLFDGAVDMADLEAVKSRLSLQVSSDLSQDMPFSFRIETRMIGDVLYFKFTDFTADPSASADTLAAAEGLEDQWIRVDLLKVIESYDPEGVQELGEHTDEEYLGYMTEAWEEHPFITITERLPDQTFSGSPAYQFQYRIHGDPLIDYILKVYSYTDESESRYDDLIRFGLSEVRRVVRFVDGTVWIDKKELLIRQATLGLKMQDPDTKQAIMEVNSRILLSDWNEPVVVEIPSPTIDFEELLGAAWGAPGMGMTPEEMEAYELYMQDDDFSTMYEQSLY